MLTRCVANQYAAARERIIEFSNGAQSASAAKGGLIEFRNLDDGRLLVILYRLDPGIEVCVNDHNGDALARVTTKKKEDGNVE